MSWKDFTHSHLPFLTHSDLVVFVLRLSCYSHEWEEISKMIGTLRETDCTVACVTMGTANTEQKVLVKNLSYHTVGYVASAYTTTYIPTVHA